MVSKPSHHVIAIQRVKMHSPKGRAEIHEVAKEAEASFVC